jgi:multidrug efflux pump subunit AcrB
MSNADRSRVLQALDERIEGLLPPGWGILISGGLPMDHRWTRDIQATQLRSFPAAFLLVFLAVSIFLKSTWLGVAAMVPTLFPVVVTLGAMGWMGMSLDVGRAMIAAVIIGIAVDDSIHLLAQYRRYRMEGEPARVAIEHAVLHVGRAVVTTSLALALGFLTLTLSAWQTISSFGFFVALSILVALGATLFLLPALIFVFGGSDEPEADRLAQGASLTAASKRNVLTLVATAPVVGALLLAGFGAMGSAPRVETACWVLPSGRAALLPGRLCPLKPHDEIREWEASSVRWRERQTGLRSPS